LGEIRLKTWPLFLLLEKIKFGFRKKPTGIKDYKERRHVYDELVAKAFERSKALNAASLLEFDDVIDPSDSRRVIIQTLESLPPRELRSNKKRPFTSDTLILNVKSTYKS
jgi:acetyl-CoA carboxylase carboxyltransferase component